MNSTTATKPKKISNTRARDALKRGNVEELRSLLALGLDPNEPIKLAALNHYDDMDVMAPLRMALHARRKESTVMEMVMALLAHGADPKKAVLNEFGPRPVMFSMLNHSLKMSQLLVQAGDDVHFVTVNCMTAAKAAASSRIDTLGKLQYLDSMNVNFRDGATRKEPGLLHLAAHDAKATKWLVSKLPDQINLPGDCEATPLMLAASFGNVESVRALLDAGADFSAKNQFGMTARDIAARSYRNAVVELLCKVEVGAQALQRMSIAQAH